MVTYNFKQIFSIIILSLFICSLPSTSTAEEDPYKIISEKNLFRPDRKPPSEKEKQKERKKLKKSKLPVLHGIVIYGDEKVAIIKTRQSKQRGKQRWGQDTFHIGENIGDLKLLEIHEKSVVLDYYGEQIVLFVNQGWLGDDHVYNQ